MEIGLVTKYSFGSKKKSLSSLKMSQRTSSSVATTFNSSYLKILNTKRVSKISCTADCCMRNYRHIAGLPTEQEALWATQSVCEIWRRNKCAPLMGMEPSFLGCQFLCLDTIRAMQLLQRTDLWVWKNEYKTQCEIRTFRIAILYICKCKSSRIRHRVDRQIITDVSRSLLFPYSGFMQSSLNCKISTNRKVSINFNESVVLSSDEPERWWAILPCEMWSSAVTAVG